VPFDITVVLNVRRGSGPRRCGEGTMDGPDPELRTRLRQDRGAKRRRTVNAPATQAFAVGTCDRPAIRRASTPSWRARRACN